MVHLPFSSRLRAGRLLADELSTREIGQNAIVLALSRGGVPLGFAVAERMHLPLDVIVARKLTVPWQPEVTMGAIAGTATILDDRMIEELEISNEDLEEIIERERTQMMRKEKFYRGAEPPTDLHGHSAVLIDDGVATGNTMLAAIRHTRSLNPARVVVGVPVGSQEACTRLRREADELVCLATPKLFFSVGQWYRDFPQIGDADVSNLLAESCRRLREHLAPPSAA